MVSVNLWELLTSSKERKAVDVVEAASKTFLGVNELSMSVDEHSWKIKLFSCYESTPEVELILTSGCIEVRTKEVHSDLVVSKSISFKM